MFVHRNTNQLVLKVLFKAHKTKNKVNYTKFSYLNAQ